ncbi:MAG: TolC family outer membrane protein [Rhodospirillaceae bacterium]|nr:TolC family outer membrane protein [Rhodospirillaceae bacterium]
MSRAERRRRLGAAAVVLGLAMLPCASAGAVTTLQEALILAYQTSPVLASSIAGLRATDEEIAQALSGYRPTVSASGEIGRQWTFSDQEDAFGTTRDVNTALNPASIGLDVSQPIYQGGRTEADVRRAEFQIQATRAQVVATEQNVLLDASIAFMNVVRDQAVLELTVNNERVLQRQLEATQDRFAVGEVTRTDVAQAESRVAGAVADRINAEGQLRISRAAFERVVGVAAETLQPPQPLVGLPQSMEESVNLAQLNNPIVIQAEFLERAAAANVDFQEGFLLPEVVVTGGVRQEFDPTVGIERRSVADIRAQVTIPLYQAGAVTSQLRQAREQAGQARIDTEDARRGAIEQAISAWEALLTSQAAIESLLAQVRAAEIALDGVQQEAAVGSRTVLDVLDAEQELLDARVTLVRAQRDEVVAGFQVLSAIGQLTAPDLALPVNYYEFDTHYNEVRDTWWGLAIDD